MRRKLPPGSNWPFEIIILIIIKATAGKWGRVDVEHRRSEIFIPRAGEGSHGYLIKFQLGQYQYAV